MNGGIVSELGFIVFIVVAGALAIGTVFWTNNRSNQLIERWASEHGYRLLTTEQRFLSRGPFFWTTSRNQTVYYVTVEAPDGAVRRAWVRCGGWWSGVLFSDDVEVR